MYTVYGKKTLSILGVFTLLVALVGQVEAADTWALTGSMSTPRNGHTDTLLPDGRVLVSGGQNSSGDALASAEIYDPELGTWSITGSMNSGRFRHTATLLPDGRVLVSGGSSGSGTLLSAEIYDPSLGTWYLTDSMDTGRVTHTATLLLDGRVLVSGENEGLSTEIYDPALGTWSLTGVMSGFIDGHGYYPSRNDHAAILLLDGRVLITGGFNQGYWEIDYATGGYLPSAEVYDPALGTWSMTGLMSNSFYGGRSRHKTTLLPDGRVLVMGGYNFGGENVGVGVYLASAEVYDPALGAWSPTGAMSDGRGAHTATPLPDGRVLVSGGQSDNTVLPRTEIYDPALGTWSLAGSMNTARYGHTATLLLDGTVLVSGGQSDNTVLASTEIFASVDLTPPVISGLSVTPSTLWPPNHKMVDVTVNYSASDNRSAAARCVLSVSSNEPSTGTGLGAGNTTSDWAIINEHQVQLRAERAATGNGRIYTIPVSCSDGSGNTSSKSVTVSVPLVPK